MAQPKINEKQHKSLSTYSELPILPKINQARLNAQLSRYKSLFWQGVIRPLLLWQSLFWHPEINDILIFGMGVTMGKTTSKLHSVSRVVSRKAADGSAIRSCCNMASWWMDLYCIH